MRRFFMTIRDRRRYFDTLDEARAVADAIFQKHGILVGIEQEPEPHIHTGFEAGAL